MADSKKKIVVDGDVSGFVSAMDKIKQSAKENMTILMQDAQKQAMSGKETLRFLEERIKSSEKLARLEYESSKFQEKQRMQAGLSTARTKGERDSVKQAYSSSMAGVAGEYQQEVLQTKLLREIADSIKEQAREGYGEDPKGVAKAIREAERNNFAGMTPEQYTEARLQQDMLPAQANKPGVSTFSQIIGAGLMRDVGGMLMQMPNARSGLDFVTPAAAMAGLIAGGGVGAAGGAVAGLANTGTSGTAAGRGAIEGLAVGSEIGKQIGQFMGEALTRHLTEQEAFQSANYSLMNLTGTRRGARNFSSLGLSANQVAQDEEGFSRQAGRALGSAEMLSIYSMRARGIDQGTASQFFGMERTGGGSGVNELRRLIGVLEEIPSINRAIYSEIANNQLGLMQVMRQTANEASGEEALRTILSFNNAGGQFSASNPLSMQNIQSVRGSMQNPGNDFVMARQLGILREMNPSASFVDLMDMMQNPTPETMAAFLSDKGMEGLSPDMQVFARSTYTGGNIQRAKSLGGFKLSDASSMADMGGLTKEAAETTPMFARQTAEINNQYLVGATEGLTAVASSFGETMKKLTEDKMKEIDLEKTVTETLSAAGDKFGTAVDNFGNLIQLWRMGIFPRLGDTN